MSQDAAAKAFEEFMKRNPQYSNMLNTLMQRSPLPSQPPPTIPTQFAPQIPHFSPLDLQQQMHQFISMFTQQQQFQLQQSAVSPPPASHYQLHHQPQPQYLNHHHQVQATQSHVPTIQTREINYQSDSTPPPPPQQQQQIQGKLPEIYSESSSSMSGNYVESAFKSNDAISEEDDQKAHLRSTTAKDEKISAAGSIKKDFKEIEQDCQEHQRDNPPIIQKLVQRLEALRQQQQAQKHIPPIETTTIGNKEELSSEEVEESAVDVDIHHQEESQSSMEVVNEADQEEEEEEDNQPQMIEQLKESVKLNEMKEKMTAMHEQVLKDEEEFEGIMSKMKSHHETASEISHSLTELNKKISTMQVLLTKNQNILADNQQKMSELANRAATSCNSLAEKRKMILELSVDIAREELSLKGIRKVNAKRPKVVETREDVKKSKVVEVKEEVSKRQREEVTFSVSNNSQRENTRDTQIESTFTLTQQPLKQPLAPGHSPKPKNKQPPETLIEQTQNNPQSVRVSFQPSPPLNSSNGNGSPLALVHGATTPSYNTRINTQTLVENQRHQHDLHQQHHQNQQQAYRYSGPMSGGMQLNPQHPPQEYPMVPFNPYFPNIMLWNPGFPEKKKQRREL